LKRRQQDWNPPQEAPNGEYVFCNADGSPITKDITKWPLWRACRRAGLRKIGWHCLRHTFASHLVMRGVPLKAVQELMGYATIEMTMRYAHLSPDVKRGAVMLLDSSDRRSAQRPVTADGEGRR
jgi:site-specific recombinase XerD